MESTSSQKESVVERDAGCGSMHFHTSSKRKHAMSSKKKHQQPHKLQKSHTQVAWNWMWLFVSLLVFIFIIVVIVRLITARSHSHEENPCFGRLPHPPQTPPCHRPPPPADCEDDD